jgi:hypothetical protein
VHEEHGQIHPAEGRAQVLPREHAEARQRGGDVGDRDRGAHRPRAEAGLPVQLSVCEHAIEEAGGGAGGIAPDAVGEHLHALRRKPVRPALPLGEAGRSGDEDERGEARADERQRRERHLRAERPPHEHGALEIEPGHERDEVLGKIREGEPARRRAAVSAQVRRDHPPAPREERRLGLEHGGGERPPVNEHHRRARPDVLVVQGRRDRAVGARPGLAVVRHRSGEGYQRNTARQPGAGQPVDDAEAAGTTGKRGRPRRAWSRVAA